jgi:phage tail sheath gpL-like
MSATTSTTPMAVIDFDEIPNGYLVPGSYTEIKPLYTNSGLNARPSRILVVGQGLAGKQLSRVVNVQQAAQCDAFFGEGSMASVMAQAALEANPFTPIDVFAVPDATSSTKASGTVTLSGEPLVATTAYYTIADVTVSFPVDPATTPSAWAASLVAAVAQATDLPVTAVQGTGASAATVTFTAIHGGACGNDIYLGANYRDDQIVDGLVCTTVAMTGGSGNPSLATVFTAVAAKLYTGFIIPWTDSTNLTALFTEAARRYNAMVKLDAHFYIAFNQGYAALCTTGPTMNCQWLSAFGSTGRPTPPWKFAAIAGAVAEFNLANDPSRQLRGLTLTGLLPPRDGDQFTDEERNQLLQVGISTTTVNPDGTEVFERVVTTSQLTPEGVPTTAWRDIMTPKTMTAIRYDWNTYMEQTYPQAKLSDDGSVAATYGTNVITPKRAQASWGARCTLYEQQGWIEDVATTAPQSVFTRNAGDRNRLDSQLAVQVIGALIILANSLQFEA